MKTFRLIFLGVAALFSLSSCELFVLDNFEQHNAKVSGRIIDIKTGENIQMESKHSLTVYETGWDIEAAQSWKVKFNGEYTNNLTWAGNYYMLNTALPCYQDSIAFTLRKGSNTVDFELTPFARIIDPQFTYDETTKKIVATCKVELSDKTRANEINKVILCCFTDCHVSQTFNHVASDKGTTLSKCKEGETLTLTIDTTNKSNNEEFKYTRKHYLRIGVIAKGTGYNTSSLYNYSETYVLSSDFKTVTKYVWDFD